MTKLEGPGANAGGGSDVGHYDMNSLPPINVEVSRCSKLCTPPCTLRPALHQVGPGQTGHALPLLQRPGLVPRLYTGLGLPPALQPPRPSPWPSERRWRQQLDKQAKKAPQQQKEMAAIRIITPGGRPPASHDPLFDTPCNAVARFRCESAADSSAQATSRPFQYAQHPPQRSFRLRSF